MIVAPPPAAALVVSPARVELAGDGAAAIRLSNTTGAPAVVDAAPAGFAVDVAGRPRVAVLRGGHVRVLVRPRTVPLAPGGSATVTVAARVGAHAAAGDHAALVVLATRPRAAGGVGVRLRVGVVVVVRAAGAIVHRLRLVRVAVVHRRLTIGVRNLGNVVERLEPSMLRIELRRGSRVLRRLRAPPRELLPGGLTLVRLRVGATRGRFVVELRAADGSITRRSARARLTGDGAGQRPS